jgi:hypothetical protein
MTLAGTANTCSGLVTNFFPDINGECWRYVHRTVGIFPNRKGVSHEH